MNQSLETRRAREAQRYDELHQRDRLYGATNHGAGARNLLLKLGARSILDVGCGDNAFAQWFRREGFDAQGCDVADRRADSVCPAHELPYADKSFDWVTSFDMLEHLWPDEIDEVLREFRRVGRVGLLVSISYEPSKIDIPGGNLHRTVEPEEWWRGKLATALKEVRTFDDYLYGKFKS